MLSSQRLGSLYWLALALVSVCSRFPFHDDFILFPVLHDRAEE